MVGPMGQNWGLISNIFFIFYFSFFIFSFSILFYKMFEIRRINWPIGPGVPERSRPAALAAPKKTRVAVRRRRTRDAF